MKMSIVSSFAAVALLIATGAPVAESVALAAQKKRACSCSKPTLRRRTRSARVNATRVNPNGNAYSSQGTANAAIVGPVVATYTLEQNQYFRLRMNQTISSATSHMGDRFKATVITPVYASGVEVVPAGSIIEGRV